MRAQDLLTDQASQRIEAAVRAAELRTSGEIVPSVVDRSDDYTGVRIGSAAAFAFAAGALVLGAPLEPRLWMLPVQAVALLLGYWITGQREVLRLLVPARLGEECTKQAAGLAFLDFGLAETRDRTGILIYVSLLEHRVVVLADRGIDRHVEPGTWDGVVAKILSGIRAGRAEDGLCDAISTCADVLAARFPRRADDVNEIPDTPRG
jgi:putative membrane protein